MKAHSFYSVEGACETTSSLIFLLDFSPAKKRHSFRAFPTNWKLTQEYLLWCSAVFYVTDMPKTSKSVLDDHDFLCWLMEALFADTNVLFVIPEGKPKDAP